MRVCEPGTLPYNDEPAKDPTRSRMIDFVSCGQRFSVTLDVPIYIDDALLLEDWHWVEKQVRERADSLRMDAAREGRLTVWRDNLKNFARTCVYNQFSKAQVAAGNLEGHAVPHGW